MSDDVYRTFQDAGVLNTVERPEPDNWVMRQGKPGRKLITGDLSIEGTGGSGSMTGAQILAALLGVDGSGSELDADKLDGIHASGFASATALAVEVARALAAEGLLAPKISPILTGEPQAPKQPLGTNNDTIATMSALAEAIATVEGGTVVGGFLPVLRPEMYGVSGAELPENRAAVSEAFDAMILETVALGGAIWHLAGRYPIERPILIPSNTFVTGVGRGSTVNDPSSIIGAGDHDLIKLADGVKNVSICNLNFGHYTDAVPTAGVAIDMRWLNTGLIYNVSGNNLWNGIDGGVCRSVVMEYVYMRTLIGTSSGMGSDAPTAEGMDTGFGILLRSTQTLLDGNAGATSTYYDRDGPGVELAPSAKGTSVILKNIFIRGGTGGDADDAVYENYTVGFTSIWLLGTSTTRLDRFQCRHSEYGLRMEYAVNRAGPDRTGNETGLQLCADIVATNGSGEGNLCPYYIHGFEKCQLLDCQANSSASMCFDVGDDPDKTYPGVPSGQNPTDWKGGFATFQNCTALTPREEGWIIRSGKVRLYDCTVAGYGLYKTGDIRAGESVAFTATSTSQRVALDSGRTGSFNVRNTGAVALKFTLGGGAVSEDNGTSDVPNVNSVTVEPGGYTQFTRSNASTQTHIAYRTTSGETTGFVGPQASMNSNGISIRTGCINGVWVHGGTVSKDNSLGWINDPGNSKALQLQSGVDNVFVDGLDTREAGVTNNSETTATRMRIANLGNSAYFFSTFPIVNMNASNATTYSCTLKDNGNVVVLNNSSTKSVTLPNNSVVPFPIGARIDILNMGTGDATISGGSGVTVRSANPVAQQGQSVTCFKTDTNTWGVTR